MDYINVVFHWVRKDCTACRFLELLWLGMIHVDQPTSHTIAWGGSSPCKIGAPFSCTPSIRVLNISSLRLLPSLPSSARVLHYTHYRSHIREAKPSGGDWMVLLLLLGCCWVVSCHTQASYAYKKQWHVLLLLSSNGLVVIHTLATHTKQWVVLLLLLLHGFSWGFVYMLRTDNNEWIVQVTHASEKTNTQNITAALRTSNDECLQFIVLAPSGIPPSGGTEFCVTRRTADDTSMENSNPLTKK